MINIKISYKGKSYNSISDAIDKALVDGIKQSISKSLKPFENEIREAGGIVTLDIAANLKDMKIELENMPDELINKIKTALK